MRISDWSSDVCSSDLPGRLERFQGGTGQTQRQDPSVGDEEAWAVGEKLAEMPGRPLPRQQLWAIAEPVVGHECDASRTAGTSAIVRRSVPAMQQAAGRARLRLDVRAALVESPDPRIKVAARPHEMQRRLGQLLQET